MGRSLKCTKKCFCTKTLLHEGSLLHGLKFFKDIFLLLTLINYVFLLWLLPLTLGRYFFFCFFVFLWLIFCKFLYILVFFLLITIFNRFFYFLSFLSLTLTLVQYFFWLVYLLFIFFYIFKMFSFCYFYFYYHCYLNPYPWLVNFYSFLFYF